MESYSQVDTEFWFAVPEISHRGSTGGKPGTLRFATLELEATVTIEMPANPAFTPIVLDIPANDDAAVDFSSMIDDMTNPTITGLENKPLTPDGINPFGLHITATNMINAYWEVNYIYGADIWSLKGSNGLGTLFYTPFQTEYPNHLTAITGAPSYSSIDVVATQDNTMLTFTLPDGVGASYGEPMTSLTGMTPGRTITIGPLNRGETFSLFPYNMSTSVTDKLAGTRIESTFPVTVTLKDDNLNTASQGRSTIGDQIVPVDITGDTYVVPAMGNPNLTFVVATQDNTNIYIDDVLYATLNEGEQLRIQSPNNQIIVISSKNNINAAPGPPFYVWHMSLNNMTRAAALLPPIGCTGNTQLAFSRAREEIREKFYFFLITENENIDNFLIDGVPADPTIIPDDITKWDRLGNGWSAYMTSNIPPSKLAIGQHLVENSGGIFHLAIINGFTSANLGDMFYGYFSDYGGLNVGAVVAGTNSSVVRACYGTPVQLHAYGGTYYEWTPPDYLDDPYSNLPFAYNLPAGAHEYVAHVSGTCGSGDVPLTVVVAPPVNANFETDVVSGCSPLTVTFEDQSEGNATWQYDLGDGTPLMRYDTLQSTTTVGPPPDPFVFSNTYVNNTDSAVTFYITLMVKNSSACADIITKAITVFPEIHSDFTVAPDIACDPLESYFTNLSTGDTALWLWEFGDGGSSTERDPVHVYRNLFGPGNLQFEASLVAISPYNCRDTSTRTVTVKPYIEAMFAYDTVVECAPHEIIITDQSIGADSYLWSFGDGDTSYSAGPILRHTYQNNTPFPVTFTLSLRVENNEGCIHEIQREVKVYPGVQIDFEPVPPEACSPAEVIFNNTSTGAGYYLWEFGDGGSSTEMYPLHLYDRNMQRQDTVFDVMLVGWNDYQCRDTTVHPVIMHPYIEAAFTVEDVVGCSPFQVEIHNESVNADSYEWDFGDGIGISNDGSPILYYTYQNDEDTTVTYPLRLVVFNEEGCSDTTIRYITVHPVITPSFSVNDLNGCHPLTVTFTDQSVNAIDYLWDFGDGAASVEHSPVHTFTNFGASDTTFQVTLTVSTSDGECVKSTSVPITVYPQVKAEFTFPNALGCGPFDVEFQNLSIGGTTFTWNFGDGSGDLVTTDAGPQVHTFVNTSYADPQDFQVSLVAENEFGCTDEMVKTVTVYPAVESEFEATEEEGCHPMTVEFTNNSIGGTIFVWDFGDGSATSETEPVHTFTNTGTVDSVYTVKLLTMAPNNACTDSFFMDITVHPYVQANFTIADKLGCTPFDVVIQNASVNANTYRWDFGDGTDTVTYNKAPIIHRYYNTDFSNQQEYEITLVAENFAGCSHEITRRITVEPAITASFQASQLEGCHPLTVDFTNYSDGGDYYHWDFGNGTTSQESDPTQTFTNIGTTDITYRVWLRATASNHECLDSTYVDILVHPYIMADFTFQEQVNCSPSTVEFHNASTPGATYNWDFGDGTLDSTTSLDPILHTFTNTDYENNGIFTVTLTAVAGSCIAQAQRNVEVYPAIDAAFSMSVDEGCHPLQVGFDNLSRGGYTYFWDFGDGATSEADSTSHTFTNFTDAPITREVYLRTTSLFNCVSDTTMLVTIHPKPKARFDTPRNIDCAPFDVVLTNTSINADQYLWNLGGDTTFATSSITPFSHSFDNMTDDIVTYEIRLTATTDYGCTDSVQQKVYVYPRTIADFTVNDGDCSPFMAHFTNQSVRGETYLWEFGDGSVLSTTDPSNLYFNLSGDDTTFLVTLTTTSKYGCVDTTTDVIDVYAQPDVEFIATPAIQMYPSTSVDLINMSSTGNWDYRWRMGDGTTSLQENPSTHNYATWGDFTIWLSASTPHCADSVAHTIRIEPAIPIAVFDTLIPGCEPHTVQLRNNSIYGESYLWEFGDGTTSTEFEPEHTYQEYGIYNVKLTVSGAGGTEYAYRQVEVYRMPVVDFRVAPDLVQLPDDEIKLFNLSKFGETYIWDFGDGTTSTEENPRHLYTRIGQYDISLEVVTEDGCTDLLVKPAIVTVEGEGYIYFPNAFKPDLDGPNGGYYDLNEPEKNNIFHPFWQGVIEYNLEIYTRWGEKLFYSNDVNIGWDGYIEDGTLSAQGVYVFRSWGIFINGRTFEKKGDVTLLYHNK